MSVTDQDWRREQDRVTRVLAEIDKRISVLEQEEGETRAEIVEFRKNFWDDVTVNLDEPDDIIETHATLRQQAEVLSERERRHRQTTGQLKKLRRLQQSPYFGCIDFREQGEREAERIYIGIGSFLDQNETEYLIYDWRAPVSSLYYDYAPGPVEYETPGGTIEGEMEQKRQFVIRDGMIKSLFDTGLTIGDELLQEVLGQQANLQMKSIVATIQQEQNRIIRNTRSRLLVVQGAAGSGKTSAAMQRVAYLLYRFRETLRAEQMVLFSPNRMFNSYVSSVLPELGEENMQQTTFQDYLEYRLGRTFELEEPFAQLEYTLTAGGEPGYAARLESIRYKSSPAYVELIERYVQYLGQEGLQFRNLKFRGEIILSKELIYDQFYQLERSLPIPNRLELLVEALLQQLKQRALHELEQPWVEEEVELLDNEEYLEAFRSLQRKKRFTENSFDDFDRERQLLAERVVQKLFKPLRAQIRRLRFLDIPAVYRRLFADPQLVAQLDLNDRLPDCWAEIGEQTVARLARRELALEDATPYLYLQEKIEGFRTNTAVRNVFIDEAQDYSAFQFAFLRKLFPHGKMTVLGDFNQAIYAHSADHQFVFQPLIDLYQEEDVETILLTKSYRSTRQIVEFTRSFIAGGESIEPFNRPGEKPTLTRVEDERELHDKIIEQIRTLQSARYNTIAIICRTASESKHAYEALQSAVDLRLIDLRTTAYEAGVLVIPSYLAKGVEFDAVILYDASAYREESERKLFYTACTRAMHELHLFASGELNPFLLDAGEDTYRVRS